MKKTFITLSLTCAVFILPVLYQHVVKPQEWSLLTGCRENERLHLAKALENYYKEHGFYPKNLRLLVPSYIEAIPFCPATTLRLFGYHFQGVGGLDTYSEGYSPQENGQEYVLCCTGIHHKSALEKSGDDFVNSPKYFSPPKH